MSTVIDDKKVKLDPTDYASMIALMDCYGDSKYPFFGENENGEHVTIEIYPDYISVETCQENHWVRKNYYHRDGTVEEMYNGKWED